MDDNICITGGRVLPGYYLPNADGFVLGCPVFSPQYDTRRANHIERQSGSATTTC